MSKTSKMITLPSKCVRNQNDNDLVNFWSIPHEEEAFESIVDVVGPASDLLTTREPAALTTTFIHSQHNETCLENTAITTSWMKFRHCQSLYITVFTVLHSAVTKTMKFRHYTMNKSTLWAAECQDVKNYKWRLNLVWHRKLYSSTHMATVCVKGLKPQNIQIVPCDQTNGYAFCKHVLWISDTKLADVSEAKQ